jgi:SAM-dependent methyltransferase
VAKRIACGSCGSNILQPFLDLGTTPLADAFPRSPDEPETFYPLGLCVCRKCWLVQNTEVVPDELLYNGDYGFYTGASPSSIAYFADYAAGAIKRFNPKFVVEIASNDGTLLRQFTGARKLGVEPSANVAKVAQEAAIPTIVEPFGRKVAADIISLDGWPDLVIANNVIAHVSDLDDFIGGLADLLGPKGKVIIEFQYVADLLAFNQFDHVYHEHRSFFSVGSLDEALGRHGLHIFDYRFTQAQGGSVRAFVHRCSGHGPYPEEGLTDPAVYAGFQRRVDRLCERLEELVWASRPVAGYGASAKSTTLLNYCGFDASEIEHVVDLTPAKIGRYTPGSRIPIVDGGLDPSTTYLLLAWNYLSGILTRESTFRAAGGKFIVPIPMPVLL